MPNNKRVVCFIFARGGSKGLPGKNIKLLSGKPLIAYSIEMAHLLPQVETVIVSTDDPGIARVALDAGAEVPFIRPLEFALDDSPEWLAWQHAIHWFERERGKFDVFISLPVTSPFRSLDDVDGCINALLNDATVDIAITVREAERNPYFNMVTLNDQSNANLVIRTEGNVSRRQDAPKVFDITTVAYVARPEFICRSNGIFEGVVRAIKIPAERALDIDTPYDFELAEAIMMIRANNQNK